MKKPLKIKKLKDENQERKFWSNIDLADYLEPKDLVDISFPQLKPTSRSISIRIPEYILVRIKQQANSLNIPYQSLMKEYIARGVLEKTK
ncbi:MAG: hypothetical protein A2233_04455 [Candidatus Kerfeldbacteria bacterium RIFOXYA2_FULL_38_24]|uniref:Uncharacterized protein n=1 Tax=Candidatus Kerfeldbacteria bacterium RIFOXYB2_FULL_38_14 TaxID=1798547 RepID=A0A1G2BDL2_9BACT|nr:MAG: hypothetical protein A2233_04455 [Candidatus Kerfeldbacteria bacterium RIFOXYA2_FULL_38_24]OGY86350.1 MAG: hypothetical protein A2319_03055 [Candidatus Kerfeldbacteria bacterium RIFOXYB2_FULL_38_14]OGY89853.1 MAG: hypothetical protein A2458_04995 [Candidatus Kerfeldbacteria bacterium RIFOXYC2_FULL_38_9]